MSLSFIFVSMKSLAFLIDITEKKTRHMPHSTIVNKLRIIFIREELSYFVII